MAPRENSGWPKPAGSRANEGLTMDTCRNPATLFIWLSIVAAAARPAPAQLEQAKLPAEGEIPGPRRDSPRNCPRSLPSGTGRVHASALGKFFAGELCDGAGGNRPAAAEDGDGCPTTARSPCGGAYRGRSPLVQPQPARHTGTVRALAFSSDGRRLYSAGDDKIVHVWRALGNPPRWVHERHVRWQVSRANRGSIYRLAAADQQLAVAVTPHGCARRYLAGITG